MPIVTPIISSSDWHSGWSIIPANQVVKIAEFRQSVTFGTLEILGLLNIEGHYIIEDQIII